MKYKFVIIGAGNVAHYFATALHESGHSILQIYNQTEKNAIVLGQKVGADYTTHINEINPSADIYLIALKDEAIEEIALALPLKNKLILHTSGTQTLNIISLNNKNRSAVFYPLQTFSKEVVMVNKKFPILIESALQSDQLLLENLALQLGNEPRLTTETERKHIHLAAVFACNFSNQMMVEADKILTENDISFKILLPLINETIQKLNYIKPYKSQTGPAKRLDFDTMQKQEVLLANNTEALTIYKLISLAIMNQQKKQD